MSNYTIDDVVAVLLRIESLLQTKATQKANATDKVSTSVLWESFSKTFELRYKVKPDRNASVNGMMSQIAKRVPAADHAAFAEFFVRQNDAWFLQQMHSPKCLLQNVEMLLTRMRSGVVITVGKARQLEQAQTNADAARLYREGKHGEKKI